ncbi:hypothetical protein M409DRAFT_53054 [Zasmidium cellare ATCC 36951]|uniref:Uncharacterized protein n=1 Tax=Zasmidium cellare ATCC 36951 TaxID=1080233 RepID=A0A6A6CMG9_ZASCE|nr:uncharacterized protein M409DRAFT_53054 [Zasmidium cellare ATCC 36951]KAF2168364.1 hypothetical protein M409DRAFT_53054 [Zasmidium cellare ATCC 36951]
MNTPRYHAVNNAQQTPPARRHIPWLGLGSITLAFGCAVTALTIGLVSNGQVLNAWEVGGYDLQPSVLLAITATVANALLAYAFAEGACLSWWTRVQTGTTLRGLHAALEQASSIPGLFAHLPHFSRVAIASVAMLVLLTDAPLLQRASTVRTYQSTTSTNLTFPVSSDPLQLGATGVIADHSDKFAPGLYNPDFAQVVQQYNSRQDINIANSTCKGRCSTEIVAPGWDVTCTSGTLPFRLPDYYEMNNYTSLALNNQTDQYHGPADTQTMFETNITLSWDYWNISNDYSYSGLYSMNFYNIHKVTAGGNGTMHWTNCTLSEALVRYPVSLENDTVSLQPMDDQENRTVHQIYRQLDDTGMQNHPSTLGGFWLALTNQYTTQANITPVGSWIRLDNSNAIANEYFASNATVDSLNSYNITWADPIPDMLATIHELSLRAAIALTNKSATTSVDACDETTLGHCSTPTSTRPEIGYPNMTLVNRTLSQTVPATQSQSRTVYHTRVGWLAGGFAVMCIACLALLPTYWGWWRLHGRVSMSPLDIARAFDAPLLRHTDHEPRSPAWLKSVGGLKVQYSPAGGTILATERGVSAGDVETKTGVEVAEGNASRSVSSFRETPEGRGRSASRF